MNLMVSLQCPEETFLLKPSSHPALYLGEAVSKAVNVAGRIETDWQSNEAPTAAKAVKSEIEMFVQVRNGTRF